MENNQDCRVFVGGVPFQCSKTQFAYLFQKYLPPKACNLILDKSTKKSKGFGILKFENRHSADLFLKGAPYYFKNHQLEVKWLLPASKHQKSEKEKSKLRIFVGGIPKNYKDHNLNLYFSKFGRIASTKIIFGDNLKQSKGFGFVEFVNREAAEKVLEIGQHRNGKDKLDCKPYEISLSKKAKIWNKKKVRKDKIIKVEEKNEKKKL